MNDELRPYPDYKSAGMRWLDSVPAHWDVLRCKFLFREIDERSTTGEETHLSMSQKLGLVPNRELDSNRLKSQSYAGGKLCRPNDLVLNRLKAHLGVFSRAKQCGVISPDYTVLRPLHGDDVTYFENVFKTPLCIAELRRSTKGIVEGFWRLYTDDFYNIRVPVPPLEERASILRFVTTQDTRIRQFIRNRRRLLDVLTEQKQEIINEAVTNGSHRGSRHKPSGNNWLGEVPASWEARRLKNVAELRVSNVDKHTKPGELPVRLCNYTDVYKNSVITADMPFMTATATQDELRTFHIEVGDVIITKDSEDWRDIGVPALVSETADDLVCGYHLAILRPRPNVMTGRFLAYVMLCNGVSTQLSLAANGVTRYGLSHSAIKAIYLPVAPFEEQEPLADRIDNETATINRAISRINREIDLIHEYRTRLIADVVTGKLDVRNLAPPQVSLEPDQLASINAEEAFDDELDGVEDDDLAEEALNADD
jgi:type I restriction enzyme S subunit